MKKAIYLVLAAMLLLCGCEYHPYYDGQKFRIFSNRYGLIETDGTHMYVPIKNRRDFTIEVYGGKGKKHNIVVDDPRYVSYTYVKASVEGGLFGDGVQPTKVIINPLELGDTSIRISDEDTGESILVYLHVISPYNMLEVYKTDNSLDKGTILAFEFESQSDVVKICRRDEATDEIDYLYDAKFRFLDYDNTLAFELTYLADADGQPDADGVETVKLFLVQFAEGGFGYAIEMLTYMNLNYLPITRAYKPDIEYEYDVHFRLTDITDAEISNQEPSEIKCFYVRSAQLNPLIDNE